MPGWRTKHCAGMCMGWGRACCSSICFAVVEKKED
jgi:hypothetical protein